MQARYLYSELAKAIQARKNCADRMEQLNPNAVSASVQMKDNEYHQRKTWFDKWSDHIDTLMQQMPSGSGFDNGTSIDLDASHAEKLVFTTAFHHMHESGMYDGWTDHVVTVTPSFSGFNLRVSGRNRNDIKEYIADTFHEALNQTVEINVR